MEKFAVDLEKVLDEFEYNEEREENVSAPSIKNQPLPHLALGSLRQIPAASYRRPSFEPINLADADFAASPPKSLNSNFNHTVSDKQTEIDATFTFLSGKGKNRNYVHANDKHVSSLNHEVNINKQIIIEQEDTSSSTTWHKSNNPLPSDEKPDLLEYNSKNSDLDSSNLEIRNQLPDVTTSVRSSSHSANNNEVDNFSNSLDLISSASGNLLIENETNHAKIKFESDEPLASEDFDICYKPDYELDSENQVLDSDDKYSYSNSGPIESVSDTDNTVAQGTSFSDSARQISKLSNVLQNDEEISNKLESNLVKDDYEIHNHNRFSNQTSMEMDEEKESKEDEMQIECEEKKHAQIDSQDFKKPIGFSNDSDLSDGDLEEYLRELEVMNESFVCDSKITSQDKSLEIVSANIPPEGEEGCEIKCRSSETCDLNDSNMSYEIAAENEVHGSVQTQNEEKFYNNNGSAHKSSKTESLPNYAPVVDYKQSLDLSAMSPEPEIVTYAEKIDYKSIDSLPVCIGKKPSHEGVINLKKNSNSKHESNLEEATVVKNHKKLKEKITIPFEISNNIDTTGQIILTNNEKIIESAPTNPFDEEDSEDIDVHRKSIKSFNDNDEYIYKEVSIAELSTPELSEGFDSDCVHDDVILTQDVKLVSVVGSNAVDDITSKPIASPTSTNINILKSDVLEENSTNDSKNISFEESSTECLPSCSSAYNESCDGSLDSAAKMIPIKKAFESPIVQSVDEAGIPAEEDKPPRPNSLELPRRITVEASTIQSPNTGELVRELESDDRKLGKIAPFWIPDADTTMCMQCQLKFNVIKRRHHCRACGQVLCYKCCGLKARLEYMNFADARVCQPCFTTLEAVSASESSPSRRRQPNPNNPMEYCSTIPPLQQVAGSLHQPPPSVMVPVGVLKREGRMKSDVAKQVMFSDGIRPGGDLTELDGSGEPRLPFRRPGRLTKRVGTPPGGMLSPSMRRVLDPTTHSFVPAEGDSSLPPVVSRLQGEVSYSDLESPIGLNQPVIKFALNRNLFVVVKRVLLDCCVNRECWCFSSEGLACVGQDEIVFLLECLPQETLPPKEVFLLINLLYQDAAKGTTVSEMSFTPAMSNNLLGSRDHGGFLYIRTSFQCTAQLVLPSPPYLVALLIHRWETPWARLFPIRLVLRLGAEFRYYPCPLVSVRNRQPLYTDIGHTIINILADFRKYSYTLPSVRGLVIHMEDRQTTINIPRNRYDQVVRALNNSNDSVLAFGANLSLAADSHLVCMQSTEDENTSYHTQAINIHNKPRKVTGSSFVVFNGALKVPGLAGKSNIVEDGLMVQVPSETMVAIRTALRDMRDYSIRCGPNAEETVVLQWTADDTNFNIGVKSCIDGKPLDGVPSIRVHNGTDYSGGTRIIRWTEVFILQCEDSEHSSEPLDISRLSESIARASCLALVPLLDLLSTASLTTLAVRTTIHPDNVGYEAGSNGERLPPLYMKSLDDELVVVVHQAALASQENPAVLELVFRIMEQG